MSRVTPEPRSANRRTRLLAPLRGYKLNSPKKRLEIHQKIQKTSRLAKQVLEIIVRPNPKPTDLFTIPVADCAISC